MDRGAKDFIVYTLRPLTEQDARRLLSWHYDPPYDFYNSSSESLDEDLHELLDPELGYHAILDQHDDLVAFCCFGVDARVPGGDYHRPALDVGWGMRPDLTGQGRGAQVVAAILDHGRLLYAPPAFRARSPSGTFDPSVSVNASAFTSTNVSPIPLRGTTRAVTG
jgi:ribosomal-protein-alanine N-acetyltransferase